MGVRGHLKHMSNRAILVVEDDEPKQKSVVGFLREVLACDVQVYIAESLAGAISILSTQSITFAVVDMSIPTFDLARDRRGGGQPQAFGGADILRFIDSETVDTMSLVITQYEEFVLPEDLKRRDIQGLGETLRGELDQRFLGAIHYNGQHGQWRQLLREALEKLQLTEKV